MALVKLPGVVCRVNGKAGQVPLVIVGMRFNKWAEE
jgi:hypothetical protein